MWKCMSLYSIMISFFLQHHVAAVSSPSPAATHLSPTPSMQKLALFQFKLSLSINTSASEFCDASYTYPKTMNWSMSSDCCTWDGVTCNKTTGDVIGLQLSCSQLVGSISPNSTLFQLSHLQSLGLDFNDFYGVLPEDIFHLPNLKQLSLGSNSNLIISLPKFKWGSSSSIQSLSLFQIYVSGGIPDAIGYLKSLTFLSLTECNISGPIPRSMGNLTRLTDLDLSFNQISGRIPDSLGNLQNLTALTLIDNNLIGPFPSSFLNLRQLVYLELSGNSLTGPLPSDLPVLSFLKLTTLNLWINLLNGTVPSWLFHIPSLTDLSIGSNGFTGQLNEFHSSRSPLQSFYCFNNLLNGTIPQSFSKLVNLTSLDLSSNNFSGVLNVEMFSNLRELGRLDLSHNSLSLRITGTTTLTPNLIRLGLSSCKITKFPHFIRFLESLKDLDLSNNQIDGEIPQWIGYTSLYNLNLSRNFLTGGLQYLPWNSLSYLDLQFNMLNESLPSSICNSSSLDLLNLSHNNLTGRLPACPKIINYSLSVLDLRMNSIGGSLPSALSNFRKLKSLNLYRNKLEGKIPPSFAEFYYLEVLDLGSNQINDTFPHWLEALPNLQVLSLKSNKLHGIVNNISKIEQPFRSLRVIDLSNNKFTGPMPSNYIINFKGMMNGDVNKLKRNYMGTSYYSDTMIMVIKGVELQFVRILTVFTTIDLSRNKFEGEIPEYIGNLKSLRYLNLSQNYLTGKIPSSVGKLSMLESLDLSLNRLVGVIPQQLTEIYSLSLLNLSHNDLSGHIPEGSQFNTFKNDSYVGNLALCGRPLSRKCEREIIETQQEGEDEDDAYFFNGFTWKAVVIGYGSGVVVGFVVGYIMFMAGKPKWFIGIIARELGLKVKRLEIRGFA